MSQTQDILYKEEGTHPLSSTPPGSVHNSLVAPLLANYHNYLVVAPLLLASPFSFPMPVPPGLSWRGDVARGPTTVRLVREVPMLNVIVLEGVIATDPKLVEFDGDRALLDLRIGHPREWVDARGEAHTEWVHLDAKVCSAKRARALAKFLVKGMRVSLTGELRETRRESEGQPTRYFHWVFVQELSLPAKPSGGTTSTSAGPKAQAKVTVCARSVESAARSVRADADEALRELGVPLTE
jgi:single-stranded DNA-binding protein